MKRIMKIFKDRIYEVKINGVYFSNRKNFRTDFLKPERKVKAEVEYYKDLDFVIVKKPFKMVLYAC